MTGWETGRMDEWMMGGWKGGREGREGGLDDGWMDGWMDWVNE